MKDEEKIKRMGWDALFMQFLLRDYLIQTVGADVLLKDREKAGPMVGVI